MKRNLLLCMGLTSALFLGISCSDEKSSTGDEPANVVYYQADSTTIRTTDGSLVKKQVFYYDKEGHTIRIDDWNGGDECYWENSGFVDLEKYTKQVVYHKEGDEYVLYLTWNAEYADDHQMSMIELFDGTQEKEYLHLDKDGRVTARDIYYQNEEGELYHDWTGKYEYDEHGNVISEEYTSPVNPDYYVLYYTKYTYQTFGNYTQYTTKEQTYADGTPISKNVYEYDEVGNNIYAECYDYEEGAYVLSQKIVMEVNKDIDVQYLYGIYMNPLQPNPYALTKYFDMDGNLQSTEKDYYSIHHTAAGTRASVNTIPARRTHEYHKPLQRPERR